MGVAARARSRRPSLRARLAHVGRADDGSGAAPRRRPRLVLAVARAPRRRCAPTRGGRSAGHGVRRAGTGTRPHSRRPAPGAARRRRARSSVASTTHSRPGRGLADDAERANALDELGWLLVYAANDERGRARRLRPEPRSTNRGLGDRSRRDARSCRRLPGAGRPRRRRARRGALSRAPRSGTHARRSHAPSTSLITSSPTARSSRGNARSPRSATGRSLEAALPLGDVLETSFEVQGMAMAWAGLGTARARARPGRRRRGALGVPRHLAVGPILGRAPRPLRRSGAPGARHVERGVLGRGTLAGVRRRRRACPRHRQA